MPYTGAKLTPELQARLDALRKKGEKRGTLGKLAANYYAQDFGQGLINPYELVYEKVVNPNARTEMYETNWLVDDIGQEGLKQARQQISGPINDPQFWARNAVSEHMGPSAKTNYDEPFHMRSTFTKGKDKKYQPRMVVTPPEPDWSKR